MNDTIIETIEEFKSQSGIDSQLVQLVVDQFGGWDCFKETAQDVANHGIDGGYGSFVYHSDTVPFTELCRALIATLAEQQADDFGMGVIEMVQGFGCLCDNRDAETRHLYTQAEVGACLYGTGDDTQIMNALAWYAGEEVCRSYCNLLEA